MQIASMQIRKGPCCLRICCKASHKFAVTWITHPLQVMVWWGNEASPQVYDKAENGGGLSESDVILSFPMSGLVVVVLSDPMDWGSSSSSSNRINGDLGGIQRLLYSYVGESKCPLSLSVAVLVQLLLSSTSDSISGTDLGLVSTL